MTRFTSDRQGPQGAAWIAPTADQLLHLRYYWEDVPVGFKYATATRTITETDIVSFAALTADFNRAHVDDEFAASGPFGKRIAHGLLVVCYMAGLNTRTLFNQLLEPSLLALMGTECRFLKPTFVGDTIHAEIELIEKRPSSKEDRGILAFRRTAVSQRGETLVDAIVQMLVKRKPAGDAGTKEII